MKKENFKLLAESTFPKKCSCCGRLYKTYKELEEVKGQSRAALKGYEAKYFKDAEYDIDDKMVVANFMECVCGSTLLILGKTRRDETEQGEKRRAFFDHYLAECVELGMPKEKVVTFLRSIFRKLYNNEINFLELFEGIDEFKKDYLKEKSLSRKL